jgi:Uma2 family endonuclease
MNAPFPRAEKLLPLQTGDRLSREVFEDRYRGLPRPKKAELLEGEVFMPSPVRVIEHGHPHAYLMAWLTVYAGQTTEVIVADNSTIRLDNHNEPQPDGLLMINPAAGGQARIDEDGYIDGAPELVAEVSASTVSIDLHTKRRVYERNGVVEYIVWRVEDEEVDWFALRSGQYDRLPPDADGLLKSVAFPGLWLDPAALVRRDLPVVLAALTRGLATPEHAAFVERLRAAARPPA